MSKNTGTVIQVMGPVLDIRFADGGFFEDYSWIPVEQLEEHNEEKEA